MVDVAPMVSKLSAVGITVSTEQAEAWAAYVAIAFLLLTALLICIVVFHLLREVLSCLREFFGIPDPEEQVPLEEASKIAYQALKNTNYGKEMWKLKGNTASMKRNRDPYALHMYHTLDVEGIGADEVERRVVPKELYLNKSDAYTLSAKLDNSVDYENLTVKRKDIKRFIKFKESE